MKKAMFFGLLNQLYENHLQIIKKIIKLFKALLTIVIKVLKNKTKMIANFFQQHNIIFLVRFVEKNIDFNFELKYVTNNYHINKNLKIILIISNYKNVNYYSKLLKQKGFIR